MVHNNSILDDIAAVIGYTATTVLVAWYGKSNLYVPKTVEKTHPIATLIGESAMRRLVDEWGGETLSLPLGYQTGIDRRDRLIANLIGQGMGSKAVAATVGITERRVQQIRVRLEACGLLPVILGENAQEKPGGVSTGNSPGKMPGASSPVATVPSAKSSRSRK